MNWDDNLLGVDVKTGAVRWRQRLGHYFAFAPQALTQGFAAQGFDFDSAEGYHLYVGGMDGEPRRRFALYGLPQRLPHRFVPALVNDRINNFAVPADGNWVASAGDLGLAVWDRAGQLLWSQDWWKTRRHTAVLLAARRRRRSWSIEGMKANAFGSDDRQPKALGNRAGGSHRRSAAGRGRNRRQDVLCAGHERGRPKDHLKCAMARLTHALPVAEGGRSLAVVTGRRRACRAGGRQIELKLVSLADGLQWILPADDTLHSPRFSPDGKRIVACSDLGSVYVVGVEGQLLLRRDLEALAAPAWLPDGDLLLATWMGTAVRLDGQYAERWRSPV